MMMTDDNDNDNDSDSDSDSDSDNDERVPGLALVDDSVPGAADVPQFSTLADDGSLAIIEAAEQRRRAVVPDGALIRAVADLDDREVQIVRSQIAAALPTHDAQLGALATAALAGDHAVVLILRPFGDELAAVPEGIRPRALVLPIDAPACTAAVNAERARRQFAAQDAMRRLRIVTERRELERQEEDARREAARQRQARWSHLTPMAGALLAVAAALPADSSVRQAFVAAARAAHDGRHGKVPAPRPIDAEIEILVDEMQREIVDEVNAGLHLTHKQALL
jgi:hypothetical protein